MTLDLLPARVSRNSPGHAAPLQVEYVRDLADQDIVSVFTTPVGSSVPPLKRITESHHNLARLLAGGLMTDVDAGRVTGYTPQRVSHLRRDPAFQELVAHYSTITEAAFVDVHEQLGALGSAVVAEIQERLETNPEAFQLDDLHKVATLTLDRSGHGPSKTVKKFDATSFVKDLMEEAKKERTGEVRARVVG